jgi:PadR family transcriptional regulator PadR
VGEKRPEVLQGTLDLMVLKTIDAMGPLHGYGIARRIEDVSGGEVRGSGLRLNQGTIHPALARLQWRGWIRAERGKSASGRRARFYELTPTGREGMARESAKWERMVGMMARFLAGEKEIGNRG